MTRPIDRIESDLALWRSVLKGSFKSPQRIRATRRIEALEKELRLAQATPPHPIRPQEVR